MQTTMSKVVCIIAGPTSWARIKKSNLGISQVSLSKEQVQHIALLARLRIDDGEVDDVVKKLSSIVAFVDQLQSAPTDDVIPMAHPLNQTQRLRPDVVTEFDDRDHIQQNAPSLGDGLYLVPKVIE